MCSLDIGSNGGNIHFKFSFGNVVIGTQLFYFPFCLMQLDQNSVGMIECWNQQTS